MNELKPDDRAILLRDLRCSACGESIPAGTPCTVMAFAEISSELLPALAPLVLTDLREPAGLCGRHDGSRDTVVPTRWLMKIDPDDDIRAENGAHPVCTADEQDDQPEHVCECPACEVEA